MIESHNNQSIEKPAYDFTIKQVPEYSSLTRRERKPNFKCEVSKRTYLDKVRQNLSGLSKDITQALNHINSVERMYAFLMTNLYCLPSLERFKLRSM